MTAKTQVQIVAKPVPLMPHAIWMDLRQVNIEQAIKRFEDADEAVPECWRSELANLKDEIEAEK